MENYENSKGGGRIMDRTIDAGGSARSSKGVKPGKVSNVPMKGGQSENILLTVLHIMKRWEISKGGEMIMDRTINAVCSARSSKGGKPGIASTLPVKGGQSENLPPIVSDVTENCENSKICVDFRRLNDPRSKGFCLKLAKEDSYDEIVKGVADHLRVNDPAKIRLTPHNFLIGKPQSYYIKYEKTLEVMLRTYDRTSDILYYEVLDIPLSELERLKILSMDVLFHSVKEKRPVRFVEVRMPKHSTVEDALNEMKRIVTCKIERKVELSNPNAEFRLLEIFDARITKIFDLNEKIDNIHLDTVRLRAEEIPDEEKNIGPCDHLVRVFHTAENLYYKYATAPFGQPFLFVIYEGEKLIEVKKRIQKKLHVFDDEFCKWNFSVMKVGGQKRLQDDDIVSHQFEGDTYGPWIPYLGLEHSDELTNAWRFPIIV